LGGDRPCRARRPHAPGHPDRRLGPAGLEQDSTDFIARELDRKGIVVRQIGPYRVRGVELTRFVSETPSTPWLAIHVMRISGKTLIFFVARPSS
jgi:hypothetical protein